MFNKKHMLFTSVIISLALFNVSEVYAGDNEEQIKDNIITEEQNGTSEIQNQNNLNYDDQLFIVEFLELLSNEQRVIFDKLYSKKDTNILLVNALSHHNEKNYKMASVIYEELLSILEENNETFDLVKLFLKNSEINTELNNFVNYENKLITEEDIDDSDMLNIVETNFNDPEGHEELEEKESILNTFNATHNQGEKTVNDFLKEYNKIYYVTDSWILSQEFKNKYPNDPHVSDTINDSANRNLSEGISIHNKNNFELALIYYNRIINEEIVTNSTREKARIYAELAKTNQPIKTADDYYNDYNNKYLVSDLWIITQEFKALYPNDPRLTHLINEVAIKNISEGQRAHRNRNYSLALIYYNRVSNEELVDNSLKNLAQKHVELAESNQILKTANDYYKEYTNAFYVSELWEIAQEFKLMFPKDARINKVINDAANKNLREGQNAHRRKDFDLALIYYNRIINENLVELKYQTEAKVHAKQAIVNQELKTSNDYYKEYNNAYYVSDLWLISQSFKSDFPNDSRLNKVINDAATKNLVEGQNAHRRKDFKLASIYYNRVANENLVNNKNRSEAGTYLKQVQSKSILKTPDDYYREYTNAYYVSDLWLISQKFKTDFPHDSRINSVINNAAAKNLAEGQNAHRKQDYKLASIYYNRINNEKLIDITMKNKAEAYYYLAENKMNLTNIILRRTPYNLSLNDMINKQMSNKPQIWHNIGGVTWRDATKSEVEKYVNPTNSMPKNSSDLNYLLSTLEIITDNLNIRSGPGTIYKSIGQVNNGDRYTILGMDVNNGWYKVSFNGTEGWISGSENYVKRTNVLQHLKLSGSSGISIADLNKELIGAGILEGQGAAFRKASQEANVNELYLIAHALLETGRGSSKLATGIKVNGKIVYNMFGIGAFDSDPEKYGSERAYELGWFTPEEAIIGGAKWISSSYISNPTYKQDTLYKMRWNPSRPGTHQYATDVRWAEGQLSTLDNIVLLARKYDLILNFDIPLYD